MRMWLASRELREARPMDSVLALHGISDPLAMACVPKVIREKAGGASDPVGTACGSIRCDKPPEVPIHMLPSRSSASALLLVSFQISPSSWVKLRQAWPSKTDR